MAVEDKRFAVLIDSDNISSKYITCILDEMTKYGVITYKRIYGDWTSTQTSKWKNELLENSITPIQQFSNTVGKNATDSALIIDAMDILYTGNVEGFCIVSSDSDFTRLASRLRESGMEVIGMGEEKTPRSFRAACTVFTNLEILVDQDDEETGEETAYTNSVNQAAPQVGGQQPGEDPQTLRGIIDQRVIENDITAIINENRDKDKDTGLGAVSYTHLMYSLTPVHWDDRRRTLTIGRREGCYPGMPQSQVFHIVLGKMEKTILVEHGEEIQISFDSLLG